MLVFTLKILPLFIAASVTAKHVQEDDLPELEWPKKYTFEAEKMSITSGLVEDVTYWRISRKSRVDYNKGAVKNFSFRGKRKTTFPNGVKYEIHPESNEEYENKLICKGTEGSIFRKIKLDKVLPDVDDFIHVGKEQLESGEVQKFALMEDEVDVDSQARKFLWVSLDSKSSTWTPVRYEEVIYNTWLNNIKSHFVWNFFNFKTDFDEEVFDVDGYNCIVSKPEDDDAAAAAADDGDDDDEDDDASFNKTHESDLSFEQFKQKYKKNYAEDEHERRSVIYHNNLRFIKEHNKKNTDFKLAMNKFADLTHEEMQKRKGLIRRSGESGTIPFPYTESKLAEISDTLPKVYDARMYGLVTPVKDQEDCGCCWTFGTTSAVEGALARVNGGRLLRLSNQALIDCAWAYGASGCDGGSDTSAYHWIMKYGLPLEEEYGPYVNKDGFCQIENMTQVYQIKGFTDVTPFSVQALKVALVNHGPLSVSIEATDALSYYNGGIFSDPNCNPTNLDHEVTLVGYGELDGEEYWIVKNSWGRDWGIDGYFHISIRDNSCGITTEPTYAVF